MEEQAALKKAFLDAAGSDDDEEEGEGVGGGLKVRSRANKERDADEGELAVKELLGDVFGKDESAMDEGDRFLRNYIMNKVSSCTCGPSAAPT